MQGLTDFSAGFGDTITFGLTRWVRKKLDLNDVVNPCSGFYSVGGVTGFAVGVVATAGLGAEADAAAEGAETLAKGLSDTTYFHCTDAAGYEGIMEDGVILANAKNRVYLTQEMVSASDASSVLFTGNLYYAGKGAYVIAIDAAELPFTEGAQANEVINWVQFAWLVDSCFQGLILFRSL